MQEQVKQALDRLRGAADRVMRGFPMVEWERVSGPGPDVLRLHPDGGLEGLTLEPGTDLVLRTAMTTPDAVQGVRLAGDELEATIFSLYPIDITVRGERVFEAGGAPVASGPALVTLVNALVAGENGPIEVRVRVPENQTTTWVQIRLTTPGLRARFELLDVAWARLALAAELAVTSDDLAAVIRAAQTVPEVISEDGAQVETVCARVAEILEPLAARAADIHLHLVGHSHIDMNWMWTWPDTVEVIKRDFRSVLALMDEFPDLTFSHSQPATYEVIRNEEPEMFARVLQRIQEGRWEPISMTWVEGDVNMASGEAMARQLLEGVRYTRDILHASPDTFHAPDTFGHAGNLPQLVASAGGKRYYHHRCNPGGADQWPAYWWTGQDGSRILGISTPSYNGEIQARDLAEAAIRALRHGLSVGLHFHGIGDHGGGPSRQNLQALHRFQNMSGLPTARCSTLKAYGDELLVSGARLPEHYGETSTVFEGCYTTHADTKRFNRQGENLLCTAQSLAALAGIGRADELQEAWRAVLFNQFHDIFDGSAIHETYEKNAEDFAGAQATATSVTSQAVGVLTTGIAPGRIAVVNPLGWEREGWVVASGLTGKGVVRLVGDQGHTTWGQYTAEGLGFVARTPAFGTVSYVVEPAGDEPMESPVTCGPAFAATDGRQAGPEDDAPYYRIDTPVFRVYVRKDCGVLTSFVDKRVSRELVACGMRKPSDYVDSARPELALNVLQVTDEYPHGMTAWQFHEVHTEHSLLRGATTTVLENGPVRCVLQVEHTVRASKIRQTITFYHDLARVDFALDVDWQEVGTPETGIPGLKASFTANLDQCDAWFETPYAAVRRPANGQEVPALRWADVGGADYGIGLLNDGKYGHDVLGCRLRLTLVRSAYDPDSISDKGQHTIRYALLPHPGDWRDAGVSRAGTELNQPLVARVITSRSKEGTPSGPWPEVAPGSSVVVAALKDAVDVDGVIVRLQETAGRVTQAVLRGIPEGVTVTEVTLVEDRVRTVPVVDGAVALAMRPWEVRSLLISSI